MLIWKYRANTREKRRLGRLLVAFLCHKLYKRPFKESLALLDLTTILTYRIIVLGEKKSSTFADPNVPEVVQAGQR